MMWHKCLCIYRIDTNILRLYAQYVNKLIIFKQRNVQHPCIGYILDSKCEVKSATIITATCGGERGGKLHMVPPYYQTNNLFITIIVPSSIMCVHVCVFMGIWWLDDLLCTFTLSSGCSVALYRVQLSTPMSYAPSTAVTKFAHP